jgi:molybdopterin/thiamine biosynthesis adenylyltransferase
MEMAAGVIVALVVLALVFAKKPYSAGFANDNEIRAEVDRYRAALKAKTLCERCLMPNAARSNYCSECGRGL